MKERLIGGAVLIAIAVWLVPWVLDGPESTLDTGASSLQLPAAEEPVPMRTQTLRLGETTTLETPPSAPPVAEETTANSQVATAEVAPGPESSAAATAAAEPRAVPATPPPPPARSAAPVPVPAAAAVAPTPAAAAGRWVVQLGSFGEEANARRVVERVATFGYQAAVSSVRSNGRTLYRVRVGPMAMRGEADATASALTAHGFVAKAVAAD